MELVKNRRRGPRNELIAFESSNPLLSSHAPIINISGEIDDETARLFRQAVAELEYERHAEVGLIILNSVGGSVFATFEILNCMLGSKVDWITYNASHAFSAAGVILACGSKGKRFASPLSSTMIHGLSAGTEGHLNSMKVDIKHYEAINEMLFNLLSANTGKSVDEIKSAIRATDSTDLFFSAQEAKDFGLVDEVAIVNLVQGQAYQLEVVSNGTEDEMKALVDSVDKLAANGDISTNLQHLIEEAAADKKKENQKTAKPAKKAAPKKPVKKEPTKAPKKPAKKVEEKPEPKKPAKPAPKRKPRK
jgi:ATP-dependent Clp protease protease subunit